VLENGNVPTLPSLSEADAAEMEEFLDQMLLVYPSIGISIFQIPAATTTATHLLYLNAKGLSALGYELPDGFVVSKNSQAPEDEVTSTPDGVRALCGSLRSQGLFAEERDHLRLTQDYTFSSPSTAAAVMLGRSANGRIEWKDVNGRSLQMIQDSAASE
jgi:hypothetical protein